MLPIGKTFNGNLLKEELGSGEFGIVYKASNTIFPTDFALKICKSSKKEDVTRFDRENMILRQLSTPPHIRIIQPMSKINIHQSIRYYLMELADCDLPTYLIKTTLSFDEKLLLFKKICEGVSYIHDRGIMHRDLWWNNVLMKKISNIVEPKLNDFGRARQSKPPSDYIPHNIGGKNVIFPPEMYFNVWDGNNNPNWIVGDVYALGITLVYILTGVPVIQYATIRQEIAQFHLYVKIKSLTYASNMELYRAWVSWVTPKSLENRLSYIHGNRIYNAKLNAFIFKLCSIDYTLRHPSINEVITELEQLL